MDEKEKDAYENDKSENIRKRILSLIDSEFESDAAFERALGLRNKTVNNWRRGRSASFMKILPKISLEFGINVGELLDMPLRKDTSELSEDELLLLEKYRQARTLPQKLRASLSETLVGVIDLYIKSMHEVKHEKRSGMKKEPTRAKEKAVEAE